MDINEHIDTDEFVEEKKKRKYFKNINLERIFIRSLLMDLFCALSFMCSYWRDEGIIGTGPLRNYMADIFIAFQFPALFIIVKYNFYNWTTYFIGLFVNTFLFAAVIEIIYYFLNKIFKPDTHVKFRLPGLIIVVIGIILMIITEFVDAKTNINSTSYNPFEHFSTAKTVLMYTAFGVTVLGMVIFAFNPRKHLKEVSAK